MTPSTQPARSSQLFPRSIARPLGRLGFDVQHRFRREHEDERLLCQQHPVVHPQARELASAYRAPRAESSYLLRHIGEAVIAIIQKEVGI